MNVIETRVLYHCKKLFFNNRFLVAPKRPASPMPSGSLQRKRSKSNQDEVQRQSAESTTAPRKLSYDSQVKRQNGEISRLDFKSLVS